MTTLVITSAEQYYTAHCLREVLLSNNTKFMSGEKFDALTALNTAIIAYESKFNNQN